jgi:ABC-type polysaccharide/polyol phosphate export permease
MSLSAGSTAIVDQTSIAGKVYFPRLILPAVPAAANLVGFAISVGVTLAMLPIFGVGFRAELVWLPVAMGMLTLLVVMLSALCAVAHVYFRDVRYIVQAVLMVMFYATPVIYPLDRPSGFLRHVVAANPVSGPLQLTRFAVFGRAAALATSMTWSAAFLVLLTAATLAAFRRYERVACDRL